MYSHANSYKDHSQDFSPYSHSKISYHIQVISEKPTSPLGEGIHKPVKVCKVRAPKCANISMDVAIVLDSCTVEISSHHADGKSRFADIQLGKLGLLTRSVGSRIGPFPVNLRPMAVASPQSEALCELYRRVFRCRPTPES
jgi:hypothetical protein